MATNLEKIKAKIADMSAEDLLDVLNRSVHLEEYGFDCIKVSPVICNRPYFYCTNCQIEWLNQEAEDEQTDTE